mgnify:CR=1 FL=1
MLVSGAATRLGWGAAEGEWCWHCALGKAFFALFLVAGIFALSQKIFIFVDRRWERFFHCGKLAIFWDVIVVVVIYIISIDR